MQQRLKDIVAIDFANPGDSIVVHIQLSLNRFPMAGALVGVRSYNLDFPS